jgi:hypothetical protein
MAENRMMTSAQVAAKAMSGEHGDLLRGAVALIVRKLMEAEVEQLTGASRGERAEGSRDEPQRVPPAGLGHPRRRNRASNPQDQVGAGVLPFVSGT